METSKQKNIKLAVIAAISAALAFLATYFGYDFCQANQPDSTVIDSLKKNIQTRAHYVDSLTGVIASGKDRVDSIIIEQTHIRYEYTKDSSRIAALPIDGLYLQISKDIATDYR